jgi:hypothetical protein
MVCIGAGQPCADELDVLDKILAFQMWISGLRVEAKETTKWCSCVSNLELMTAIFSIHCLELEIFICGIIKEHSISFTVFCGSRC